MDVREGVADVRSVRLRGARRGEWDDALDTPRVRARVPGAGEFRGRVHGDSQRVRAGAREVRQLQACEVAPGGRRGER